MSILVLGGDGYIGWPLVCRLAQTSDQPIIAVDSRLHAASESASVDWLTGAQDFAAV